MSLEIYDDEVKKKHIQAQGGGAGGDSIHGLSSKMLLFPTVERKKENKDGSTETIIETDVKGRTEYVAPSNMANWDYYGEYLDKEFGAGRGNTMRMLNNFYSIDMTSKNRQGRKEYVTTALGSAISGNPDTNESILKKVQEQ